MVIEQLFGLPGLGWTLLNGIYQRDYPVVQGTVLFFALVFALVNLAGGPHLRPARSRGFAMDSLGLATDGWRVRRLVSAEATPSSERRLGGPLVSRLTLAVEASHSAGAGGSSCATRSARSAARSWRWSS